MSAAVTDEQKARRREIHRKSMILTGAVTIACGAAGAFLAFAPSLRLPDWLFGGRPSAPLSEPAPRAVQTLVRWREWSPALIAQAKKEDKLILLDLRAPWARQARLMDLNVYSDKELAELIERTFIPVRVDAQLRPDLALRYLASGWPTTALLIPTGEILDAGTVMSGARFKTWATALERGFRMRRRAVMEAAARSASERRRAANRDKGPTPAKALDAARQALEGELGWPDDFGPRFPRLGWAALLDELDKPVWAKRVAKTAAEKALALEDLAWGGVHRYAAGPGWRNPEFEKRLEDQADALNAFDRLKPESAARVLRYVRGHLADPEGGYYASQACELARPDGRFYEGRFYFALSGPKRRALGEPWIDKRHFAEANGLMAAAVLSAKSADAESRAHALKTLDRFWSRGVRRGLALRALEGGPSGLLADQIGLAEGFLAAYATTREKRQLKRALALVSAAEAALWDDRAKAFFDRPPRKELAADLDQLLVPTLNARMRRLLLRLARAAPPSDAERLESRARQLAPWLWNQAAGLDPAELAALAAP